MTTLMTQSATQIKPASFTVNGKAFAEAVRLVAKASGTAYGRAALITLAFKDQRVAVGATDFETVAQIKIPVQGKKATTVAVDAMRLKAFAAALKNEQVHIDVAPELVTLTAGELEFTMPPEMDAPMIVTPDQGGPVELDIEAFVRTVKATAAVASSEDARPILTGILFDTGMAVATDSYRLMVVDDAPDLGATVLVPAVAASLAAEILSGEEEAFVEILGTDRVHFMSAMRSVTVRIIQGEFPNWRNLMPVKYTSEFEVDRQELINRLGKIKLAISDSTPARLRVDDDQLFITVTGTKDTPGSKGGIDTVTVGEIPTVGFNPEYLRGGLAAVDGVRVTMKFVDPMKPFVTIPTDGSGWTLLQMPVRIPS